MVTTSMPRASPRLRFDAPHCAIPIVTLPRPSSAVPKVAPATSSCAPAGTHAADCPRKSYHAASKPAKSIDSDARNTTTPKTSG